MKVKEVVKVPSNSPVTDLLSYQTLVGADK